MRCSVQTERKTVFRVNQARCRVNKMEAENKFKQQDLLSLIVFARPRFGPLDNTINIIIKPNAK